MKPELNLELVNSKSEIGEIKNEKRKMKQNRKNSNKLEELRVSLGLEAYRCAQKFQYSACQH